jgi:hypothetical protein
MLLVEFVLQSNPKAEAGGLVCRMPLGTELNNPSCNLHYSFQVFLDSYQPESDVGNQETTKVGSLYNAAKQFLKHELEYISSSANENGKIDPEELDEGSVELLQLYAEHQVCLTFHLYVLCICFFY